ncbi:unnamed protein product, partial [Ectocarpus sp. 4 AP-2014]
LFRWQVKLGLCDNACYLPLIGVAHRGSSSPLGHERLDDERFKAKCKSVASIRPACVLALYAILESRSSVHQPTPAAEGGRFSRTNHVPGGPQVSLKELRCSINHLVHRTRHPSKTQKRS